MEYAPISGSKFVWVLPDSTILSLLASNIVTGAPLSVCARSVTDDAVKRKVADPLFYSSCAAMMTFSEMLVYSVFTTRLAFPALTVIGTMRAVLKEASKFVIRLLSGCCL
jgi:hypothetical protein